MNFPNAVRSGFKSYLNYRGRASRSELWWWVLFLMIAGWVADVADMIMPVPLNHQSKPIYLFNTAFGLLVLIPTLMLNIRRIHDFNWSGWWLLFPMWVVLPFFLLPAGSSGWGWAIFGMVFMVIGWFANLALSLVIFFKKGTSGPNKYGRDPLTHDLVE